MKFQHRLRYVTAIIAALLSATVLASEVHVVRMTGEVSLRSRGALQPARLETTLTAPVEVRTGADGRVTLRQLGSELNVGPNSVVILPDVPAQRGAPQKIEQRDGRVLYSVDRKDREFIVETRHLVSVVKGTVFSIASDADGTQVSLLEGSLEVSAPGIEESILLRPNESATRNAGGAGIQVEAASIFAPATPATAAVGAAAGLMGVTGPALAMVAAWIGRTRLTDVMPLAWDAA